MGEVHVLNIQNRNGYKAMKQLGELWVLFVLLQMASLLYNCQTDNWRFLLLKKWEENISSVRLNYTESANAIFQTYYVNLYSIAAYSTCKYLFEAVRPG